MTEPLFTCPVCQTRGFTAQGLKRHRCNGINRTPNPPTPVAVAVPAGFPTPDMICVWLKQDTAGAIHKLHPHREDRATLKQAHHYEKMGKARKAVLAQLNAWLHPAEAATPAPAAIPPADPAWEVMAPAGPPADPAALVASINDHHARAQNDAAHARAYGSSAVKAAVVAGLQLINLREATPHGQWEQMFTSGQKRVGKSNANHGWHLDFSAETARKYIAAATPITARKLLPAQSAALMELAATGVLSPAASALLDEIIPDKSLRQYYIHHGIVPASRKEREAMQSLEEAGNKVPPATPAAETQADRFQHLRASARKQWFGTATPGMLGDAGVLQQILTELNHPADGSLPYLHPDDLRVLATNFRRISAYCLKLSKEHP